MSFDCLALSVPLNNIVQKTWRMHGRIKTSLSVWIYLYKPNRLAARHWEYKVQRFLWFHFYQQYSKLWNRKITGPVASPWPSWFTVPSNGPLGRVVQVHCAWGKAKKSINKMSQVKCTRSWNRTAQIYIDTLALLIYRQVGMTWVVIKKFNSLIALKKEWFVWYSNRIKHFKSYYTCH